MSDFINLDISAFRFEKYSRSSTENLDLSGINKDILSLNETCNTIFGSLPDSLGWYASILEQDQLKRIPNPFGELLLLLQDITTNDFALPNCLDCITAIQNIETVSLEKLKLKNQFDICQKVDADSILKLSNTIVEFQSKYVEESFSMEKNEEFSNETIYIVSEITRIIYLLSKGRQSLQALISDFLFSDLILEFDYLDAIKSPYKTIVGLNFICHVVDSLNLPNFDVYRKGQVLFEPVLECISSIWDTILPTCFKLVNNCDLNDSFLGQFIDIGIKYRGQLLLGSQSSGLFAELSELKNDFNETFVLKFLDHLFDLHEKLCVFQDSNQIFLRLISVFFQL